MSKYSLPHVGDNVIRFLICLTMCSACLDVRTSLSSKYACTSSARKSKQVDELIKIIRSKL